MRRPDQLWYDRSLPARACCLLLWPLSLLFACITAVRRTAFHRNWFAVSRLTVQVVVVGNISVGGTGKTPLTIALAQTLAQRHYRPGIITRGYGGSAGAPQAVDADSDPAVTGDEALLLARHSGCPVWIGANRVAAARGLLAAHPDCNLLLSDDGLQHYALGRDIEIAVIDAARGFGNGLQLPAGPLREPVTRLAGVAAIVVNGDGPLPPALPTEAAVFRMTLCGERFTNLRDPQQHVTAAWFAGRAVHAAAAIGNPQRFFDHLRTLGIAHQAHAFPDHHVYRAGDLDFGPQSVVIMTAKDAVKCERFAQDNHWVLQVEAVIDGDLTGLITQQLGRPH